MHLPNCNLPWHLESSMFEAILVAKAHIQQIPCSEKDASLDLQCAG
jgi:hypothetical protein